MQPRLLGIAKRIMETTTTPIFNGDVEFIDRFMIDMDVVGLNYCPAHIQNVHHPHGHRWNLVVKLRLIYRCGINWWCINRLGNGQNRHHIVYEY